MYPLFIWLHLVKEKVPIMFEDPDTYCQKETSAFLMLKIKFMGHLCEAVALFMGEPAFQ